ncbi:MAG: HAD hydrolase-like protein [Methanomicrobiales archaeon]|nr:HAD hydrolase-like protein [Methanomicrobiales archaeon]
MIQLVILDFDGVILESVAIKTKAFRELFSSVPAYVDEIVAYHQANSGVSRFDKFRHIYESILHEPLTEDRFRWLARRYAELVVDGVLASPFVPGALEFLGWFHQRLPLYIVSATPQDEIRFIVKERGLSRYFRGVFGSPRKKVDCIREILATSGSEPGKAVYVGDAPNDLHAARALGVRFVGRVGEGGINPFSGEGQVERIVKDLHELGKYLEDQTC